MTPTFADNLLLFLASLRWPAVPPEIEVMNPYADHKAWATTQAFYKKYYSDSQQRTFIIGINPGRFGGGITGIPFTDPIRLEKDCGIPNGFAKRQELSSAFIYQMIRAFGGSETFYSRYCFSAVSPVGFTMLGKNLNYYDHPALLSEDWVAFMVQCMKSQLTLGVNDDIAYVLGQGENLKFLLRLNEKHGFFKKMEVLPHPRWVMQYRLKRVDEFVALYLKQLA